MTRSTAFSFRSLFVALFLVAAMWSRPALAFDTSAEYGVLVDAETGAVLWEKDGDVQMHPASMSKLMTLSMLFEALKAGTVKLTDELDRKSTRLNSSH